MIRLNDRIIKILVLLLFLGNLLIGCGDGLDVDNGGDGGGGDAQGNPPEGSNRARFYLDCDLNGQIGNMIMDIEAIGSSGVTWGAGPNPDITGVIGTGEYTLYVSGTLQSPNAYYIFSGENQFADFTEVNTYERFRVQWVAEQDGLIVIVNPFGDAPERHYCEVTNSERL
jgi:hypothetical protein